VGSAPEQALTPAPPARPVLPADEVGPPAEVVRRVVARVADAATIFFLMWALSLLRVFWFIPSWSDDVDPDPWGRAFVATVTFVVLYVVYEVVFLHWNKGQTPGRDWMDVRVVAHGGGDPSVPTALTRAFLPAAAMLLAPLWLAAVAVGALGASAWGPRRRSLPDLAARTTVVHWDRDAHEAPDPRALRRRPRALGMVSGLFRQDHDPEQWVVPDERTAAPAAERTSGRTVERTGAGTGRAHLPAPRRPVTSVNGKRRPQ